ncbi:MULTISPECIES: ABC transporter substrate-binding protein [Mediterraneibacter]|uniref:ABC transporter substrate-binding protein n=1 Tax=Mediterraneibacter TaxID=2316020 RepID=UPI000E4ABD4B|nr:ABC transporter substrate-binding protein [Mediterraneibacter massiliensis]RGT73084.1 LacI family transcriptional regulator [Ruminococcus sp. AF18-22]
MKKKVLSVLLCTAMVASLAIGCGSKDKKAEGSSDSGSSAGGDMTVEVVAKGFQHDFWKAVNSGAEKAAEENGVKMNFVGPKDESAVAEQVEQLNNAINKKPSAIVLASLDPESVKGALDTAASQNIPVIGFDSGVPGNDTIVANAATDNYAAGEMAAENMYELIKDKVTDPADTVRIGVVSQDATSGSIIDRTAGFIDKMVSLIGEDKASVEGHDKYNKKVDGAKVIIEVGIPATVEDAACVTVANTLLNKADLVAIYGSNEFSAKNIVTANESLDKLGVDKIVGVGFDAGKIQLDAVRNGIFAGSITQNPVQIGYQAVDLAVKAAKGEEVSDVDTGALWYTAENIDDEEIAACLYE